MFARLLSIVFLLTGPLPAQDGPVVRFLAERVPPALGKMRLAAGDVLSPPFDMPSNYLSPPVEPPAREFQLRSVQPDALLSTVKLPDEGKSFIAILIPDPKGGYRPVVIRADDAGFRQGDVYFYNHADKTVLGEIGSVRFALEPSQGKVIRPAGARDEGFYDVRFGVREEKRDRVLSSTRWPVDQRNRSYVFFFVNPSTKRIDFRAVDEFVPPS